MDSMKFCYSCAVPVDHPDFKGPVENYCRHCTDEQGHVKSRMDVQNGIAQWLKMWQPDLDDRKAMARADLYMRAMPHWAD